MQAELQWNTVVPDEAVAGPAKSLEIAPAKTTEVRKRLLEVAMPALQRKRLERLDMYGVWLGVETSQSSSRSFPDASSGRAARHGDSERQPVLDGADETSQESNCTNAESSSGTPLWRDKTRAKKAVEAADWMLMVAQQKLKETLKDMEQANIALEVAKKEGPATGLASDVTMLLELLRPHLDTLFRRTQWA